MANYGMKISIAGEDVKTVDDLNTIIHSKYANLKGTLDGSGSVEVPDETETTVTINHNLGYIPFAEVFIDESFDTQYHILPDGWLIESIVPEEYQRTVTAAHYCTSTQLIIKVYQSTNFGDAATETLNYKYFIFTDKGNVQ